MKFYFQSRALFFSCLPLLSPAALAQPVQDHIKPLNWIIQLKQHDYTVQPRYAPDLWHTGWRHSQSQSSGLYTESAAKKCGAQIQATNESIVSDPQFLHMICKNFQKAFTEGEAQAYIAFLSTPMGQSIDKKAPACWTAFCMKPWRWTPPFWMTASKAWMKSLPAFSCRCC